MFRSGLILLTLSTLLAASGDAFGQQNAGYWDSFCIEYHRNVDWPSPFVQPDRAATIVPFSLMIANGWRRQNLLSDYHFIDDGTQLNLAGETKLRFILTQMPPARRAIFVQRGLSPDVTTGRLDMVQRAGSKILGDRGVPLVLESDLPNDGWPADDIDAVDRRFRSTRPDPRLSNASSSSSSGTTGGAPGPSSSSGN